MPELTPAEHVALILRLLEDDAIDQAIVSLIILSINLKCPSPLITVHLDTAGQPTYTAKT